ncbi:hypothetical protein E4U32_003914 [Claviceps aff. humidiphila group G2b]|nr:hypothetical protein E4U32_003914 [Claviceps aff. humidiphila group G2b]
MAAVTNTNARHLWPPTKDTLVGHLTWAWTLDGQNNRTSPHWALDQLPQTLFQVARPMSVRGGVQVAWRWRGLCDGDDEGPTRGNAVDEGDDRGSSHVPSTRDREDVKDAFASLNLASRTRAPASAAQKFGGRHEKKKRERARERESEKRLRAKS